MNLAQTLSPDTEGKIIYMNSSENGRIIIYKNEKYTWLVVDDVIQSAIENTLPYRPVLSYCFVMLLPIIHHKVPDSILELGAGGLSIQRYLSHAYPSIKMTSIENNQEVLSVVDENFPAINNPSVIKQNAFNFIESALANTEKFDWIMCDLFQGDQSPVLIKSQTLYKQLFELINPNGWLIINCLTQSDEEIEQLGTFLKHTFNNKHYVFSVPEMMNKVLMVNKINHFSFPEGIEECNEAK